MENRTAVKNKCKQSGYYKPSAGYQQKTTLKSTWVGLLNITSSATSLSFTHPLSFPPKYWNYASSTLCTLVIFPPTCASALTLTYEDGKDGLSALLLQRYDRKLTLHSISHIPSILSRFKVIARPLCVSGAPGRRASLVSSLTRISSLWLMGLRLSLPHSLHFAPRVRP